MIFGVLFSNFSSISHAWLYLFDLQVLDLKISKTNLKQRLLSHHPTQNTRVSGPSSTLEGDEQLIQEVRWDFKVGCRVFRV